ncbi:MAG: hypothetical protein LBV62_00625 [Rickettsiales bacterium]|jgi:flagellar basal body-associated protein FliL|nr:hypothetical protein [Rickettsiales bacterium]
MPASDNVLKRYALAYIKKSGGNSNVKEFLRFCNTQNTTDWSEGNFEEMYKGFIRSRNPNNGQNTGSGSDQQTTSPQVIHVHTQNTGLSFWDYLLLQCCIDALFGGRGHTTNITNINYGNNSHQNRKDKKKESEDNRKLLALGIVAAVVCVAFHIGMCFWYHSSKKAARKEEKIDYLDNKLKMFRNIEFAVSAVSLVALITCVFYPVLPVWGLAFHMKHEKESDNIDKAEKAVRNYGPPPPYSFQDPNVQGTSPSAPPYQFDNTHTTGQGTGFHRQ